MVLILSIVLEKIKKRNKILNNTSMATLNNYSSPYFPDDPNNMSYEETAYFIYGVDIDEKEEDKEKK